MVSRRGEPHDLEDRVERQGNLRAGDGAKDACLGCALGQPLCGKSETGGTNEREEDTNDCRKDMYAIFEFGNGGSEIVRLTGLGCEGDDGWSAPTSPTLDGGTRNIDLGNSAQIPLANLLTQPVVVHAAVSAACDYCGFSGFKHGFSKPSQSQISLQAHLEFPSDSQAVAFASTRMLNVLTRRWVKFDAWVNRIVVRYLKFEPI